MEDNRVIDVTSRIRGMVVYIIPDMQNLRREFTERETKKITFQELRMLANTPGGRKLIEDYLYVHDKEALEALGINVEPEYYYGVKEITQLMTKGSLDEFLDCLDFAPQGVLNVVKELAVSLPLNDVAKREAILDKLNFDVTKAIEFAQDDEEDTVVEVKNKRRAAVRFGAENSEQKAAQSGRRVKS